MVHVTPPSVTAKADRSGDAADVAPDTSTTDNPGVNAAGSVQEDPSARSSEPDPEESAFVQATHRNVDDDHAMQTVEETIPSTTKTEDETPMVQVYRRHSRRLLQQKKVKKTEDETPMVQVYRRHSRRLLQQKKTRDSVSSTGRSSFRYSMEVLVDEEPADAAHSEGALQRNSAKLPPITNEEGPSTTSGQPGAIFVSELESTEIGRPHAPSDTAGDDINPLRASIVDENPMVAAEPVYYTPKRVKLIIFGVVLMVAALIVAVALPSRGRNNNNPIAATGRCTGISGKPFENSSELDTAVQLYLYQSPFLTLQYGSCIGDWNVSMVKSFRDLFSGAETFNEPIGGWDTSSATDMASMFEEAPSFNQPISDWNMASVTSTRSMFEGARSFNHPISDWNMTSVTSTSRMFQEADSFNQDISGWDVSNVRDASRMFFVAPLFNNSVAKWDVRNMKDVERMFLHAFSFNQNLCEWLPKLPEDAKIDVMFFNSSCESDSDPYFPEGPLCHECQAPPDRPVCTNNSGKPFETREELIQAVDLYLLVNSSLTEDYGSCMGDWNVSLISNFDRIFDRNRNSSDVCWEGCRSFYLNVDLSRWDTSAATSMDYMFIHSRGFNSSLGGWDVSGVTSMVGMFAETETFNQPLADWDVSQVTAMDDMFIYTTAFNQDLSNWNVSAVRTMPGMFLEAQSFNQDLCEWLGHLSVDADLDGMFYYTHLCPAFPEDDILLGVGNGPMCHFCA